MTPKKPLQIGDRVRVYSSGWSPRDGTVIRKGPGVYWVVAVTVDKKDGETTEWEVYPQQCRRLRPRKREEKPKPRKLPVLYVRECPEEKAEFIAGEVMTVDICNHYARRGSHWRRFRLVQDELHEGEIILSRKELENAYCAIFGAFKDATCLEQLCTALGFEEDGE